MRTLGFITTGFIALVALFGLVIGVRSIPDVRRYFRIRSM